MDPSKDNIECKWKLNQPNQQSPHVHVKYNPNPKKIYDDVLDAIGKTPMIRLNKIGKEEGIQCQILGKCQFMNMGGSIKDRIGKRMILDAEIQGRLKKGDKIVEATSGNTGISLSLAAAVKGYQIILTLPEKMSIQKVDVLKGLGAKVIRTPTQVPWDSTQSHLGLAKRIRDQQGAIYLDQHSTPSNPIAHYDETAEQILYQCDGKIDAIVASVGTGGTITGLARKIKQKSPSTLIIGVDPHGSILAMPQQLNSVQDSYKIQAIGYDFVPKTLDRSYVDEWIKTSDIPSFKYARQLIRKQGLLVGGSSGAACSGAIQFLKKKGWGSDKRVVIIFSDSVRNYITKFLSKQWCIQNKLIPYDELKEQDHPFNQIPISDLCLEKIQAYEDLTIGEAKELFEKGAKLIPIKKKGQIISVIKPQKFLSSVLLKKLKLTDSAINIQTKQFVIIPSDLDAAQLQRLLQRNEALLVETKIQGKIVDLRIATYKDMLKLYK